MEGNMYDLILLISGVSNNVEVMDKFLSAATRCDIIDAKKFAMNSVLSAFADRLLPSLHANIRNLASNAASSLIRIRLS